LTYIPKKPTDSYIDRPEFRHQVLELIQSGLTKNLILGDTHAIYGTGKTTALSKIFNDLKNAATPDASEELIALRDRTPIWLSLDEFSVWHANERIIDLDSWAVLTQNFHDFKKLLVLLGKQIDPQAFEELGNRLDSISDRFDNILRNNDRLHGEDMDLGTSTEINDSELVSGKANIVVNLENREEISREALKRKITQFTQEFLNIYKPISQQKKIVLIADDFCWIMSYPIGGWFLNLVKNMDNLVTLLSRTITDKKLNLDSRQIQRLDLKPFDSEEVRQYMLQRELDLTDAQIEKVFTFSKSGHPLLVSLAGDLLALLERRDSQDVDIALDRLVGKPKGNPENTFNSSPIEVEDLNKPIDRIIDELYIDVKKSDPKLLYGLNVITLARKFDYTLLKFMFKRSLLDRKDEVWDESNAEEEAKQLAHKMTKRMKYYSVVQELEDRNLNTSVYRVHFIVRKRMEVNLEESEPCEYIQQIHNQLIAYYQEKETENIKAEEEYTAMFRLEHTDWQNDIMEWLYHLSCLKDLNRSRLLLSKFFLEAFDWWGWYIAFDFCKDLCTDFLATWNAKRPEDLEFVQLLQAFHKVYPTGYEKRGKGDWNMVLNSMMALSAELKLDLAPAQMNSDQRMVLGHLDRYIAEGYRFNENPDFQIAKEYYDSSLSYFEVPWNKAWIVNYLADLYLDWMNQLDAESKSSEAIGKAAVAEKYAEESNQMAFEERNYLDQDHELMSQNYRILGRVYLWQNECPRAFQALTRSIAHAYIFHFLKDNQDDYSFQFYKDTGEQILQALLSLIRQGRFDEARDACKSLRGFWERLASHNSNAIFSALQDDFDLDTTLSSEQTGSLRQYLLPVLPEVGTVGTPIRIGVAVSRMISKELR
jgi:hypothetical protein